MRLASSGTFFLLLCLVLFNMGCGNEPFTQGKNLYTTHCENCHMANGTGLGGNIPPLAQSDYLQTQQQKIACIIRYGQADTIVVNGVTYNEPMAGVKTLNEVQLANLINYLNQAWGNDYGFVTVEQVHQQLVGCK
ncbi:MAG: cytochrome c class I [Bacteroidetes bacterium]|nr:MAG: cytochrome c class I [Bacteroidota bacterium]PTM13847.1 MAG: cytochrome c class I [Bacteroidota bacterium]